MKKTLVFLTILVAFMFSGSTFASIQPGGGGIIATAVSTGTSVQTIDVGGSTAAIVYSTSTGAICRIDLLLNSGVTDYGDATATGSIAWAIAQLTSGGRLHLGSGTYPVDTLITVNESILIDGDSEASTIIQAGSAIGSGNNFITISVNNVGFTNVTINANGCAGNAIYIQPGLSGFNFLNVNVQNAVNDGLIMISESKVYISNSTFIGNGTEQLYIYTTSSGNIDDITIEDSVFNDTGAATRYVALFIADGTGVTVQNIKIINNAVYYTGQSTASEIDGIVVDCNPSKPGNNINISRNSITYMGGNSTGAAIEIYATLSTVISGNTINGGATGISAWGMNGVVSNNAINNTSNVGIYTAGNPTSLLISGNQIYSNSIDLITTNNNITVTGNFMYTSGSEYVYEVQGSASNIVISNNTFESNGNQMIEFRSGSAVQFTGIGNTFIVPNALSYAWNFDESGFANCTISGNVYVGFTPSAPSNIYFENMPSGGVKVADDLPTTFANLPSTALPAGSRFYCTDCAAVAGICGGSGTGSMAISNGTNWTCQ